MADESLTRKSACELAALVKSRAVSPIEVLDAHLAVIERVNPRLNAIVTLAADRARAEARAVEAALMRGDEVGPLAGLPVAIKDLTDTAGVRTTYGSPLYRDHVPSEDAEIVRRLRAAGAVIIGKTNTPEFGAGASTVNAVFGATLNPWNYQVTPAGSSGGSAVAVATGMAAVAQGTDFGGSVRVPAAFCGIVGIRPTPGLTPSYPSALAWDFGQVQGPLARSAEDCALTLDAMVGFTRLSPISVAPPWVSALDAVARCDHVRGLRIAYAPDIAGIGVDPEVETICRQAALGLRSAGAAIDEIAFDASDGRAPYQIWRGAWMVGRQFERLAQLEQFGANLRGNVEAGLKVTTRDLAAAEQMRQEVFQRFRMLFESYDVLLTPAAPVKPFPVGVNFPTEIGGRKLANYIDWLGPTFLITLVSLPAASVPAGRTSDGLPVGLQVIAPRFEEPRILSVAKMVQVAHPMGWPPHAG